jgi:hypothetical protein
MCLWIDLVPPHYNPQFQIRSIQVESRSLRLYGATGKAGSVILKELVDRLTSSSLQPALQKRCERSRTSPQSRTTSAIRQRPPASSRLGTPSSRPMGRHQSRHRPYGSPRQSYRGGQRTPTHRCRRSGQPLRRTGSHAARVRTPSQRNGSPSFLR